MASTGHDAHFFIGAASRDVTGPAGGVGMMGYAQPGQRTGGIHMRLWARAFAIESTATGRSAVIVCADLWAITEAVRLSVLKRIAASALHTQYDETNVHLCATHTHSGPGGYSKYLLYHLTTFGVSEVNIEVIADGIYQAIGDAHERKAPATIGFASGELGGLTANRSLLAYLNNPAAERNRYDTPVDCRMRLLRFDALDRHRTPIGLLCWYPIHATSIWNRNRLISGDNKGLASYFFERKLSGLNPQFVAAFAQGALGDVSPLVHLNKGKRSGGFDDAERSGKVQNAFAYQLWLNAVHVRSARLDVGHTYVDLSSKAITSAAALGVSMLAGAEDGPGIPFLREGITETNLPRWLRPLFQSKEQLQKPKPIWCTMGKHHPPGSPPIVPLQILILADLALVGLPFEPTTMAARRIEDAVARMLLTNGVRTTVIAGVANGYAGYLATPEEYDLQHYEGASTHFGRASMEAVRHECERIAQALSAGSRPEVGPRPHEPVVSPKCYLRRNRYDREPKGAYFGDVTIEPGPGPHTPGRRVNAEFWASHPGNDPLVGSSFAEVRLLTNGTTLSVASDTDPELSFTWKRLFLHRSKIRVEWTIPAWTIPGDYLILLRGKAKDRRGDLKYYEGQTVPFKVS